MEHTHSIRTWFLHNRRSAQTTERIVECMYLNVYSKHSQFSYDIVTVSDGCCLLC
jgi:hypothetical protein